VKSSLEFTENNADIEGQYALYRGSCKDASCASFIVFGQIVLMPTTIFLISCFNLFCIMESL